MPTTEYWTKLAVVSQGNTKDCGRKSTSENFAGNIRKPFFMPQSSLKPGCCQSPFFQMGSIVSHRWGSLHNWSHAKPASSSRHWFHFKIFFVSWPRLLGRDAAFFCWQKKHRFEHFEAVISQKPTSHDHLIPSCFLHHVSNFLLVSGPRRFPLRLRTNRTALHPNLRVLSGGFSKPQGKSPRHQKKDLQRHNGHGPIAQPFICDHKKVQNLEFGVNENAILRVLFNPKWHKSMEFNSLCEMKPPSISIYAVLCSIRISIVVFKYEFVWPTKIASKMASLLPSLPGSKDRGGHRQNSQSQQAVDEDLLRSVQA